jgi:hypothetical protein
MATNWLFNAITLLYNFRSLGINRIPPSCPFGAMEN